MDIFKDKVATVTGGGSGIGKALCERLARLGAKVVLSDNQKITIAVELPVVCGRSSFKPEVASSGFSLLSV